MLGIIGLLETKISPTNLNAVTTSINLPAWKFLSNAGTSPTCRILVGWDPSMFNLSCLQLSDQWVTCDVFSLITKDTFKITFVYGLNTPAGRSSLWNYIKQQAPEYSSAPWILLGDFNAILKPSDRSGGDQNWNGHQNDFGTCIQGSELTQIPYSGLKFTWHNGQLGGNAIMRKLDWIFGNHSFLLKWPSAHYKALPRDHSDHSALILECQPHSQRPPASSFKFLNFWADREDFMDIVSAAWQTSSAGNPIYSFTTKLKTLKLALRDLHRHNSNNISKRVADAKAAWTSAQVLLDSSPATSDLIALERDKAKIYAQLCREEEAFYRQRSRVQWLHLGDRNTKFFHRSLVHRQSRNRIHALTDESGNFIHSQEDMGQLAVRHFQRLLIAPPQADEDISRLFPSSISGAQIPGLEQPVTNEEIKTALFSIPDDKAPGPDGFTSLFFKKSWSIIGADFMRAVRYFFEYSIMPRCINATRISLVPKVENPACMDDYRPISCCNVLYKCISKVLVARLKLILSDVISPSQSAFIPGRQISDNILLTQELLHNYHLNKGPARCALKIDLKKAFDTISWQFILKGLQCIGIPVRMINWINACISSAFFSVGLNGSLYGFFPSSRGLRQGDPLSPYLFVIAMEGLGGILRGVAQVPGFQFHWRCKLNSITHLAFADDLMVFCHADLASVELIRGALESFSSISGLIINHNKSISVISLHPPLGLGENCFSAELGAKAILPPSLVMVGKPRFGWITGCQMVEGSVISSPLDCYHLQTCHGMLKWLISSRKEGGHSQKDMQTSYLSGTLSTFSRKITCQTITFGEATLRANSTLTQHGN
ncbi:hypothetical protein NC651_009873 [Populus alba x Populus x berolinensis]|nr:hypothetical protein NC651_009873 [Populus alba x Populus x berolinensis]